MLHEPVTLKITGQKLQNFRFPKDSILRASGNGGATD